MCPSCGATRGKVIKNDEDEDGRPLRLRRCPACGTDYPTIESVIVADEDVSFYSLAARRRDYERYRKRDRRRRGPKQATSRGRWLRAEPFLEIRMKIRWRDR